MVGAVVFTMIVMLLSIALTVKLEMVGGRVVIFVGASVVTLGIEKFGGRVVRLVGSGVGARVALVTVGAPVRMDCVGAIVSGMDVAFCEGAGVATIMTGSGVGVGAKLGLSETGGGTGGYVGGGVIATSGTS